MLDGNGRHKEIGPIAMGIISRRGINGWSQEELAKRAGVHPNTVGRIELGGNIRVSTLHRVLDALTDGKAPRVGKMQLPEIDLNGATMAISLDKILQDPNVTLLFRGRVMSVLERVDTLGFLLNHPENKV